MIAANSAVAQRIHTSFPRAAILRRHPAPPQESFAELHALLQSVYSALPPDRIPVLGEAATATNGALAATLSKAESLLPPQVVSLIKVSERHDEEPYGTHNLNPRMTHRSLCRFPEPSPLELIA